MKKFEYKIFNLKSDTEKLNQERAAQQPPLGQYKLLDWIGALNCMGFAGWQMVHAITPQSFLLMREISI